MNIIFDLKDCLMALLGGALIGISATTMMLFQGRVAGISGILYGIFTQSSRERLWRVIFIMGLLFGGILSFYFLENPFESQFSPSLLQTIIAGLIVGVGTQVGSGCTSGHGVCGISRLSLRSIVATILFISSGILTVWLMGRL